MSVAWPCRSASSPIGYASTGDEKLVDVVDKPPLAPRDVGGALRLGDEVERFEGCAHTLKYRQGGGEKARISS